MNTLQSWHLGDAIITKIPERESSDVEASFLFPQWNHAEAQSAAAMLPVGLVDIDHERLALSTHSWLVQLDGHAILIDTASGNDKERPLNLKVHHLNTGWMDALRSTGLQPDDITSVLLTHLHVDHVGWNTIRSADQWVPTFAHARYYFSAREYQFYRNPANVKPSSLGVMEDSVQPVVDAGLHLDITEGTPLPAGFEVHRLPGHSYDHLAFSLTRNGETALFWRDALHNPLQVALPHWNSVYCESPQQAYASRLQALELAQSLQALVFTTHFPASSVGHVVSHPDGLRWQAA